MKKNYHLHFKNKNILWCFYLLFFTFIKTSIGQEISFSSSGLSGESINNPTSLDFGPDNKLYVTQQDGTIWQYTIGRDDSPVGEGTYTVTESNTIDLIQQNIPNHTDDGLITTIKFRQVTGILTAGTAENPVLYVTSSDNLIGGGGSANDKNLDTNSGMLSRLTYNGSEWEKVDLVRGLPRCEENHSTNGMDIFTKNGDTYMLLQQGGHTNMGAPSNNFVGTPEYLLSGSILIINLTQLESMTTYVDPRSSTAYIYDLPTLNDPEKEDIDNTSENFPYPASHPLYNATIDLGDPFGGNDGKNQAFAESGGPVQVFSPGYRNAYDVVVMENGNIYTYDNGPNINWGGLPVIYTADGVVKGDESTTTYNPEDGDYIKNDFNENGTYSHGDVLHYIGTVDDENNTYYGGHPNPIYSHPSDADIITHKQVDGIWTETTRYTLESLLENVSGYFNTEIGMENFPDNPTSGKYLADKIDSDEINVLDIINSSTNGICEYTASNFDDALKGNLLSASFNGNITRYVFNESGNNYEEKETIFSGFGSQPLDIIALPDNHIFAGTIWAATYGADNITVFEPTVVANCFDVDDVEFDATADYDNDGFTNQDEIDNGTNYCSGGSTPNDNDGDLISDLNDTDDDNDGILDVNDVFAIDPDNGTTTNLPLDYSFFNNDPGTGFYGLGFTGLMLDPSGNTDYLDQYDPDNLSFGGAAGKASIDSVDSGDPINTKNSQNNAFQLGINVDSNSPNFTIQSRVESPFFAIDGTGTNPTSSQAVGIYIGNGDQDNYLKLVIQKGTAADDDLNGVQVLLESDGARQAESTNTYDIENILSGNAVDLYANVKPSENTTQFYLSIDGGETIITIGEEITLPSNFLDPDDNQGLAVGIIATSYNNASEFSAVWDYFLITEDNTGVLSADTDLLDFGSVTLNDDDTQINLQLLNESGPDYGVSSISEINITGENAALFSIDTSTPFSIGPGKTYIVPVTVSSDDTTGVKNAEIEIIYDDNKSLVIPMTVLIKPNYIPYIRINAGGTEITTTDDGPNWSANNTAGEFSSDTYYVNTGQIHTGSIDFENKHSSIPDYIDEATFNSIFIDERYDAASGDEMEFSIPVPNGEYLVNLFLGNTYNGTSVEGTRVYDILIENEIVQDDLDLVTFFGSQAGGMLNYVVNIEDETLNISFGHEVENPLINAIEIQRPEIEYDSISIIDIEDIENFVSDQVDFAISVSDGDPFLNYTYSIEGQPEGIQVESTNGQVFGIIDETALDGGISHDGVHDVTITVSQENGDSASIAFTWSVSSTLISLTDKDIDTESIIESFSFYDDENNIDVFDLYDGGTFDLSSYDFVNIRANTVETVGSLGFILSGGINHTQTESYAAYDLFSTNGNNGKAFPNGEYILQVNAYDEEGASGNIIESIEISFTISSNSITIFPNPTSENITIDTSGTGKVLSEINIQDLTGLISVSFNTEDSKVDETTYALSVESMSTGVYILSLVFEDGTIEYNELIIN